MDSDDDLTVHILREIRHEIRETQTEMRQLIRETQTEMRELNAGTSRRIDTVDHRIDRVEHRITESEVRLSTEIQHLAGTLTDVHALLRGQLDLRGRVDGCERDIAELQRRVP